MKTRFRFRFRITPLSADLRPADGIAFVLQNQSLGAIGTGGFGQGYSGVTNSLAIELHQLPLSRGRSSLSRRRRARPFVPLSWRAAPQRALRRLRRGSGELRGDFVAEIELRAQGSVGIIEASGEGKLLQVPHTAGAGATAQGETIRFQRSGDQLEAYVGEKKVGLKNPSGRGTPDMPCRLIVTLHADKSCAIERAFVVAAP